MRKAIIIFFTSCSFLLFSQQTKAEFPGGTNAFQKEFMQMVHAYVDTKIYAVDGKFTFIVEIDEAGKMANLKIFPKVRNHEEFLQDMNFALKRIKKKWKPATENGIPKKSTFAFEINFTTDYADHGD